MPYNKRKQKCKQSDGSQGNYVLSYTDKKGKKHSACHTSKKNMQGQIAAIEAESVSLVKSLIREILQEEQRKDGDRAAYLPDFLYSPLEKSIKDSAFWSYENTPDDADMINVRGEWHNQTPAAEALGNAIEFFFSSFNIPITIAVRSAEPESNSKLGLPVSKDHRLYPNRLVVGGSQGLNEKGRFVMYLNMLPVDDDFEPSDVSPVIASRIVANIVRHEYIHARQIEKRRRNQKISRVAAKKRYEVEGEIPDSSDRSAYLGANIEIDAYAHEFAEALLQRYGKETSIKILRRNISFKKLDLPDQLIEYLDEIPGAVASRKLISKVYSHIMNLSRRKIYERYSGSYPDESYQKADKKKLYLDKPSSHGGWPEGEYEPSVNDQISSWLKSMKMMENEEDNGD
jgi:hypothetical protein